MSQMSHMQEQPQQSVDKQPKQKRFSLPRLTSLVILLILGCVFPIILYVSGRINFIVLSIFLGISAIAIPTIAAFIDDIIEFIQIKLADFRNRRRKAVFLISYISFNIQWANWIEQQLIRSGYQNEVRLRKWKVKENNFKKEIYVASKEAHYVMHLVSHEYLEPIRSDEMWYHNFKKRIKQGSSILINIMDTKLDAPLVSLPRIDIVGADINGERAEENLVRFLNGLPARFRRPPQSLTEVLSAYEDEGTCFPGDRRNIPDPSPVFTGREDILKSLHIGFVENSLPQALYGIQGIGTTAITKKYAHLYRGEYTCELRIRMPPNQYHEEDIKYIGSLLKLLGQNGTIQELHKQIMGWLDTHDNWLLLLDRCENPVEVRTFIPLQTQQRRGHILLTTSVSSLGQGIRMVPVGLMEERDGALFLLRRASRISSDDPLEKASLEDQEVAINISRETRGFPKILNLAGNLVENGMTLSEFLEAYKAQRRKLTEMFRHFDDDDAPTVFTGFPREEDKAEVSAWYVAFEKLKKINPEAADLLQFCAFFYHDTIPLEVIEKAPTLISKDHLDIVLIVMELKKYSLLERDNRTGSLRINPYVQTVLRDEIDNNTKKALAEHAVRATHSVVCPYFENNSSEELSKYIQHAEACADFILEYNMRFEEAVDLLNKVGKYTFQIDDRKAEEYLTRAKQILEDIVVQQTVGSSHE